MEDQEIEITVERSQQLADIIMGIRMPLYLLDVEYARACVKSMHEQASRMDSMAALSMRYNPDKSELIHMQANMLQKLIEYIELGKQVDEKKSLVARTDEARSKIDQFFM